jgi:hypothetical protein
LKLIVHHVHALQLFHQLKSQGRARPFAGGLTSTYIHSYIVHKRPYVSEFVIHSLEDCLARLTASAASFAKRSCHPAPVLADRLVDDLGSYPKSRGTAALDKLINKREKY